MSKRFVDTEIWNKAWYQELSLKEKVLVKYIFEQCDCAGVWDINFRLASFIIGETVSFDDIDSINNKNLLFEVFDNDKLFVIDFIKFQYGTLSENCKPHKPIIEKLKKYNLYERVFKGYSKGIETLEEQEQEQETEKEKEKEKEKDKEIECFGENLNVVLVKGDYQKLLAVTQSKELLNEVINDLGTAIRTGKEQPYKDDLPYAHYERLRAFIKFRKEHPNVNKHVGSALDRKYAAIKACFSGGNNG